MPIQLRHRIVGIVDETRGSYRLLRPGNSSHPLAIGRVLGVKVGKQDAFYPGVVRELVEELDGTICVTLNMMPGKPEATSVQGPEDHHKAGATCRGFRLAPMPALKVPETLVVPSGLAQPGRGIDIFHPGHGSAKEVRVVEFVERGADFFDRVTIKWSPDRNYPFSIASNSASRSAFNPARGLLRRSSE